MWPSSLVFQALLVAIGPGEALSLEAALEQTFAHNPTIKLAQQDVSAAKAALLRSYASFDTILSASSGYGRSVDPLLATEQSVDETGLRTDAATLELGVTKGFATGTEVGTTLTYGHSNARYLPSSSSVNTGLVAYNQFRFGLYVSQELLRNRGSAGGARAIEVQELLRKAAQHDYQHTVAASYLTTVQAYWSYALAYKLLAMQEDSEKRTDKYLREMQILVQAQERPEVDLLQIRALYQSQKAARIAAQQAVIQAKHALGSAVGLLPEVIANLPPPQDGFPQPKAWPAQPTNLQRLVTAALSERGDITGSTHRLRAVSLEFDDAAANTLPSLSVVADVGYAGRESGSAFGDFFAATTNNIRGVEGSLSLVFEWPVENSSKAADLMDQRALRAKTTIRNQELKRSIAANISLAYSQARALAEALAEAKEAANQYRTILAKAEIKLRVGRATTLDLVVLEEQWVRALTTELTLAQSYASSMARLQFEVGQLVRFADGTPQLAADPGNPTPVLNSAPQAGPKSP